MPVAHKPANQYTHPWTKGEDEIIKKHYPDISANDLRKLLPRRTECAIIRRARKLKVYRTYLYLLKEKIKTELTEWEKGYLAGIIDGEGSISISDNGPQGTHGPRISVGSTSLKLIRWLNDKICPAMYPVHSTNPLGKKCIYIWETHKTGIVRDFLKTLLPFLIIKKKQAEAMLEFCECRAKSAWGSGYSKQEIQLINELRKLNQ